MENCLFCKIIAGEIPATVMYEDEDMLIIRDIEPKAKNHFLLLPKSHFESVLDASDEQMLLLARALKKIGKLTDILQLQNGFRMVINQGGDAGQTVHHLHVHILSGQKMGWTPA